MKIDLIAGARPNFMKIAPIVEALENDFPSASYRLVHTGQHYDERMSGSFFSELGIPKPHVHLNAGGGTHAQQTGSIMAAYESLLAQDSTDLCLVVGDVTSTMACAITAQKVHVPVAHVEAGIRSGDWSMPEEINRMVTDAITNWFFTTSEWAGSNLEGSGVSSDRIFFVGNTMIDTLVKNLHRLRPPSEVPNELISNGGYFCLTLHRPSNVDCPKVLGHLIESVCESAMGATVVFPVHPRTASVLNGLVDLPGNLLCLPPLPYLEFVYLVKNGLGVVTDSGGVTEEATYLKKPCITLRRSTERPETVDLGTNILIGDDELLLKASVESMVKRNWKKSSVPPLWDGMAAKRIVSHLKGIQRAI